MTVLNGHKITIIVVPQVLPVFQLNDMRRTQRTKEGSDGRRPGLSIMSEGRGSDECKNAIWIT